MNVFNSTSSNFSSGSEQGFHIRDVPPAWIGASVLMLVFINYSSKVITQAASMRPWKQFPLVSFEEDGLSPKDSWLHRGKELLEKGSRLYPNGFQIMQATGPRIILGNSHVDEIRKVPGWSFLRWVDREFFAHLPGMEPFASSVGEHFIIETVRTKLTQSLNHVTQDLSEETESVLEKKFGNSKEWKNSHVKNDMQDLVARLSSRVFLGKELTQNEEWISISKDYASTAFQASKDIREWNPLLLPVTHWFIPNLNKARHMLKRARQIINPEVQLRTRRHDDALARGEKPAKLFDAVSWILDVARGRPVDVAVAQLTLSTVAIATTTELTSYTLLELCRHPEHFAAVRREIADVLGAERGWSKNSLYNLKLLDSAVKETQRLHPAQWSAMRRWTASSELTLADGTVVPRNASVSAAATFQMDPDHFPDPHAFDPYRFLRLRQRPGQESAWQLVTASVEHQGWGYGEHACPGRFFAANEIKVALVHLLMKYDWRIEPGVTELPEDYRFEVQHLMNEELQLQYRRRESEIEF